MLTYSQLDFQDLRTHFGVEVNNVPFLPVPITPLAPPAWLQAFMLANPLTPTIAKSEKAVSEAIIYPMLAAVRGHYEGQVGLYSGEPLSAAGLTGVCDFIFSTNPTLFEARQPIVVLVEAKRHDMLRAVPQCVGEMIAAQYLNQEVGAQFPAVYGCVTTGNQWQFLRLSGEQALVDPRIFYQPEVPEILGAFSWVISQFARSC